MSTNREILMKFITGQNEKMRQDVSMQGYKDDSPYRNNPSNTIYGSPEGTSITMEGVSTPLVGTDEFGNTQKMFPGQKYEYPGSRVVETPMAKYGGLLNKTIKCSNCGWSWKAADGGKDVTTCHKCGNENKITHSDGEKDFNKVKEWYNNYIDSPLYKRNLENSGYIDVDKVIDQRKSNIGKTEYVYDENRLGTYYQPNTNVVHHAPKKDSEIWSKEYESVLPQDTVLAHELGHSVLDNSKTFFGRQTPGYNKYDYEQLQSRNKDRKISRGPNENYADQKALQYEAAKLGIYKPGFEEFTKEHLDKLPVDIKDRALQNYSEEDLIWLMNNIAQNENDSSDMYIAKRGGTWFGNADEMSVSNKYQNAGTVTSEERKPYNGYPPVNNIWLGNKLTKEGYITSTTKGGNYTSFTGNDRADDWINKQIDSGKFGFDPKTMSTFPLKKPVKGLSKEDQFIGTKTFYDLQAPQGFTSESQDAQIKKLPEWQQDIINEENTRRRKRVVKDQMDEVYKSPLWYLPGAIATGGLGLLGLEAAGAAAAPYITTALATQLPGMAAVPGATVGNVITAGFAGHGLANVGPDTVEMYKNPSWSNAGSLGMDVLEIAPIVGPAAKTIGEGISSTRKGLSFNEPAYMSLEAPKGNMYGENQVIVQQQRLLNPDIKAKFFQHQAPEIEAKIQSNILGERLWKAPKDYGNRITPENYEDFINRIHGSTNYDLASSAGRQPHNLGVGNYGVPGKVFSDAPLDNLGKDIINAHEKNHGIFAGTLSKEMEQGLLKPFGTNKPIPHYAGKHQADEVLARMGQFKNAVGIGDNQVFTLGHLNLIRKNYAKQFLDNGITEMLAKIKPGSAGEKEFLKNMNKYAFGATGAGALTYKALEGQEEIPENKEGGLIEYQNAGTVNPTNISEKNINTNEAAQRVVQIAEERIKNNNYVDVPKDIEDIAKARGESAFSCIGGVCTVLKEAGVMDKVDWSNTHFSEHAKEYGFTANQGWGVKGIENLEPGDVLQYNNKLNKQGNYYPGHSQIYLGKDASGQFRFFDNFWKTERTYFEDDVKKLLDRARKKTELSATIYKVNPYDDSNPLGLTPEEKKNYDDKQEFIKNESKSKQSYIWSVSKKAKNYNDTTKRVIDAFIEYANDNDKINDLVKKTGKSKEEIHDSLLNVFGELGAENNWTTSKGKGVGSFFENVAESVVTAFGGGKKLSVGPGQIKYQFIPKDLKEKFNIKSPNDLYDLDKVLPLMAAMDLKDKQVLENWGKNNTLSKKLFGWTRPAITDNEGNIISGGFTADQLYTETDGSKLNNGIGRYSPYLRNQYSSIASGNTWEGGNDWIPFNEGTLPNFTEGRFTKSGEDEMRVKYERDSGSYPYKVEQNWRDNLNRTMYTTQPSGSPEELDEVIIEAIKKNKKS